MNTKTLARLFKTYDVVVNVSLKFQTLISEICQYFSLQKMRDAFAMQKLLSFF